MEFKEPYVLAMRDQAPRMLRELSRTGALQAHLNAKSREAHRLFEKLTAHLPKLPNGEVRDTAARQQAERSVLDMLIEFPEM